MTDVEHVLRDALDARAGAVAAHPLAYERVVRRRTRRRLARWTAVAAASAAAVGVALVAVPGRVPGPVRPAEPVAPPSVGPMPPRVAGVQDGSLKLFDGFQFRDFSGTSPDGYATTAVATAGNDHYFLASVATEPEKPCRSRLNRYDVSGTATHSRSVFREEAAIPGPDDVSGKVVAMAVTRDETRLAYYVRLPREWGTCGSHGELRVRDLRTGAERVWRPAGDDARLADVTSMSWHPDGRRLAVGAGFAVLDTAAPGDTLTGTPFDRVEIGRRACAARDKTFHPRTGNLVAWVRCTVPLQADNGVYEYGDHDKKAVRKLFAVPETFSDSRPQLTFDASGDHLLVKLIDGGIVAARWNAREGLVLAHPRLPQSTLHLVW